MEIYNNIIKREIRYIIVKFVLVDYFNYDVFVYIILIYGEEGLVYGIDGIILVIDIIFKFKLNVLLVGKLKIFFF